MEVEAKHIAKYKGRSVAWLIKNTQIYFNRFIRQRDGEGGTFDCISCGKNKPNSDMDAGHFRSTGNYSYLRFDEDNCHGQCQKCNRFLGGELYDYSVNLVIKIGQKRFEKLHLARTGSFKWDKIELIGLLITYQAKAKQ